VKKPGGYVSDPAVIPPLKYAECVRNCYLNMLTGHSCGTEGEPDGIAVNFAIRRMLQFAFVGITDYWHLSVCLWHAKFGGRALPVELRNVRPGLLSKPRGYNVTELFGTWEPKNDMLIWKAAVVRFFAEVKAYNLTEASCRAGLPEPLSAEDSKYASEQVLGDPLVREKLKALGVRLDSEDFS